MAPTIRAEPPTMFRNQPHQGGTDTGKNAHDATVHRAIVVRHTCVPLAAGCISASGGQTSLAVEAELRSDLELPGVHEVKQCRPPGRSLSVSVPRRKSRSSLQLMRGELGVGLAGWAHRFLLGSSGWVESVQDEWWAADLAALEAADRAVHAHDGAVRVELNDDAVDAV
jgi:hypothetical protein